MTKSEFIATIKKYFKNRNFYVKGTHFYKNLCNDVMLVIGLQKSNYGEYYYAEYGFCFCPINRHLPYPKFYEANIRCGRLTFHNSTPLDYESMIGFDFMKELDKQIDFIISIGEKGKESIAEYYLNSNARRYMAIIGENTIKYLGISAEGLTIHPDIL